MWLCGILITCLPHPSIFFPPSFTFTSTTTHTYPSTQKMADDLFDGAIGIDLGTTYSYVASRPLLS
jgi:hypothetical protein